MANWSNPILTSLYTDVLTELKNRDVDLALQFDGTSTTNLPTGAIRWNSTISRWQKWNGSSWGELTAAYAFNALSTSGNASIGGTLTVTGATALNGGGTTTTPATADNSTKIATTAFVKAQNYALSTSPAFTGTPTAPTAALGDSTTLLATTAFVVNEISSKAPTKTGGGASGTWGINITGTSAGVSSGPVNASTGSFTGDVTLSGTGQLKVPSGTTGERSGTPSTGMIRYNTTLGHFEGYGSGGWDEIGGTANDAVKAWVNFNGTGAVAVRASYNVSSVIDINTGEYQVVFTNALADANFCTVVTVKAQDNNTIGSSNNTTIPGTAVRTTGSVLVFASNSSSTRVDAAIANVAVFR